MPTDTPRPDPHETAESQSDAMEVPPWEEIAAGRFMPRRIRGSYRGGKLG